MAGYAGCRTPLNRVLWLVFAVLAGLAVVLLGFGVARTVPCARQLTACGDASAMSQWCQAQFRDCARRHAIVAGAGVLSLVLALVLVCCMCCCSPRPKQVPPMGYPAGGVQMGHAHPHHQPLPPHYGYAAAAPAQPAPPVGYPLPGLPAHPLREQHPPPPSSGSWGAGVPPPAGAHCPAYGQQQAPYPQQPLPYAAQQQAAPLPYPQPGLAAEPPGSLGQLPQAGPSSGAAPSWKL